MFTIADYAQKSADLTTRALNELKAAGADYALLSRKESAIKLVFAGQYSAGKSSILKMLTGNKDIEIGPGITTQKTHVYMWNGMEVIDTPGINSELRPDHDKISYEAISNADMVVFVITSHLFDAHIAEHFRKLAIDKDKGKEMILVVNKMEESGVGNTEWQRGILRDDLCKVILPFTPEQLHLCFLDAQSYLDSLEESDPEIIEELRARSGFSEFVDALNSFVAQKEVSSKLTTNLYTVGELLQKGIQSLEPKSDDDDVDALLEFYLQQRHILVDGKGRLHQEIRSIFTEAATKVRNIGLDAANYLVEGCSKDDVEEQLEKAINSAETIMDDCQNEAVKVLESRLTELGQAQDNVAETDFARELEIRLSYKYNSLPEGVQKLINNSGNGIKEVGLFIADKAYKPGINAGLKLGNFSGGKIHEIVLKAGHAIGFKFKPWQAVKLAKGVGVAGKALGVLGIGLNVFFQIKSDHGEEQARIEMQKNRQNIRSQFNSAACELEDFGKRFVDKYVVAALDDSIHTLDAGIQEIRAEKKGRSTACKKLEALQSECYSLIREIHAIE